MFKVNNKDLKQRRGVVLVTLLLTLNIIQRGKLSPEENFTM